MSASEWAFCRILLPFSDSVYLDVESRIGEFLGALDGQQLLVVEGSGVMVTPGVRLSRVLSHVDTLTGGATHITLHARV